MKFDVFICLEPLILSSFSLYARSPAIATAGTGRTIVDKDLLIYQHAGSRKVNAAILSIVSDLRSWVLHKLTQIVIHTAFVGKTSRYRMEEGSTQTGIVDVWVTTC